MPRVGRRQLDSPARYVTSPALRPASSANERPRFTTDWPGIVPQCNVVYRVTDWAAVNATLEEQYNCAVCREYNASWQSPNSASIWLLNVVNTTVIKASDFEKWAKVLKSKVDQIVVAPSKCMEQRRTCGPR